MPATSGNPTIVHSISGSSNLIQSVPCNAPNFLSLTFQPVNPKRNMLMYIMYAPKDPSISNKYSTVFHMDSSKMVDVPLGKARKIEVDESTSLCSRGLNHLATSSPEKFRDDPQGDQRQVAHMPGR